MGAWRSFYGVDWAPVPDGRGGMVPVTKEFAGLTVAKKWRLYKKKYDIEFKDPWVPLLDAAKALIPEQYFRVPPWTEEHFHDWVMSDKGAITWGCGSCGKALLPDEPVYYHDKVGRIGDVKPGDMIFASTGSLVRVRGVYRQLDMPLYRVKFADGSETVCAKDHLWTVRYWGRQRREGPRSSRKGVMGYVVRTLPVDRLASWVSLKRRRPSVPVTSAVRFAPRPVPLDPYVLGVLLGDGSLTETVLLTSHRSDSELRDEFNRRLGRQYPGYGLVRMGSSDSVYTVENTSSRRFRNPVNKALRDLGLYGRTSIDKFVPDCYKVNDVRTRKELLAGLFDTDGTVGKNGHASFTTVSKRLAEDVKFLLESIGATATITAKRPVCVAGAKRTEGRLAYTVYVRSAGPELVRGLFKLSRKRNRVGSVGRGIGWRGIVSVEPVEDRDKYPRETVCITIEDRDVDGKQTRGLFPIGDFIVTHNSNDYGLLMLLDWITDPYDTATRLGSTDKQSLKSRSWNAIVTYFAALKHNKKGLIVPGKFSKSGYAILNDDSDDSPESVGEKAGIVGVAVNDSADSGKLQGAHAKYVRLVIDELATITHHGNIKKAMQNLRIGATDFRFYALANPASWEDESCQYCIPENGVSSVNPDTGVWTSTRGYLVRHHDGLKCITVTNPEKAEEYPFLITKEVVEANLADCDGNTDAPTFWQMVRGFPSASAVGAPPVLDVRVADAEHVAEPCPPGEVVGVAAGLDPAWTEGGDGAVYQRVILRDIGGMLILDFGGGQRKLRVNASSNKTVTEQLCSQVKSILDGRYAGELTAPITATAVDASGNQNLADNLDIFIGRGAASCVHVNNSNRASARPIRKLPGIVERNSENQIERCCDRYQDRGTESWCVLAEFCRAGMVRGLPPGALRALTMRRFMFRKNTTTLKQPLQMESKDEFKIRFKGSPDETDACALAALAVKEVLGVLPYDWMRPAACPIGETIAQKPAARFVAPVAGSYSVEQAFDRTYGTAGEPRW